MANRVSPEHPNVPMHMLGRPLKARDCPCRPTGKSHRVVLGNHAKGLGRIGILLTGKGREPLAA